MGLEGKGAGCRNKGVSKSLLAIAGIGVAGCILLSSMMKQLVQHKQANAEAPPFAAIERRHQQQLVGALQVHEESVGMTSRLVVRGRVAAGVDKRALATAMAAELWQRRADDAGLFEVEVTLRDADGSQPVTTTSPRPRPASPR